MKKEDPAYLLTISILYVRVLGVNYNFINKTVPETFVGIYCSTYLQRESKREKGKKK